MLEHLAGLTPSTELPSCVEPVVGIAASRGGQRCMGTAGTNLRIGREGKGGGGVGDG